MRWTILALALAVLVIAAPPSASSAAPSLRLVSQTPLTLRGTGFRSGETVRVTLTVRVLRAARTLRADTLGRFRYRPPLLLALDPCHGTIVVRALGLSSRGQATWKRACRPPDVWP
jgi:hypothetical protein